LILSVAYMLSGIDTECCLKAHHAERHFAECTITARFPYNQCR
jgi:hypothetical protein